MKITSYIETYFDKRTHSVKTKRVYFAQFKEFFGYGVTIREAIARVLNSLAMAQ